MDRRAPYGSWLGFSARPWSAARSRRGWAAGSGVGSQSMDSGGSPPAGLFARARPPPGAAPPPAPPPSAPPRFPPMSTSFPLDGMRVRFAGDTNVGMKRAHNEDSFYLPESERLAIVADGMGGHASGEVASKMAVETIAGLLQGRPRTSSS